VEKSFFNIWSRVLVVVLLTTILVAASAKASVITSANDFVSNLKSSEAANHRLLFTTPSGISEGQTLVVTFASAFDTSSITEDDVDLYDDGTSLSTAVDCSGTEKYSAVMSFDGLTFTACAGDGGAIAAASQIEVRVGTNATNSGTGVNQIINPSTQTSAFVSVSGSFGDFGSIILPIRSGSNGITVTTVVPMAGAPVPPPPPPPDPSDKTAPVVSNVVVSLITQTSATISWITNEQSTSVIQYGLTDGLELNPITDGSLVTVHSLNLTGLQEGKLYYFVVNSTDSSSNKGSSSPSSFTTLDLNAPVIADIGTMNVTKTSAVVVWSTNEASTSVVEYGTTDKYGLVASDAAYLMQHSVSLSGLTKNTTYYFRVKSLDAASNTATSAGMSFLTLNVLPQTNVSGLTVTEGNKQLGLSWTNPTNEDFASVRVLFCQTNFPSSPTDQTCSVILDQSTSTSASKSGLTNGQTYYFGVFAKNTDGQFASGALAMGQPKAPEEEVPIKKEEQKPPVEQPGEQPSEPAQQQAQEGEAQSTSKTSGSGSICGDGICTETESAFSCPSDCKTKTEESKTGMGSEATFSIDDVQFSVAQGAIMLKRISSYLEMLPATTLSVRVPASVLGKDVGQVTLSIGPDTYLMREDSLANTSARIHESAVVLAEASSSKTVLYYLTDILMPAQASLYPVTMFVEYKDGSMKNVSSFLRVVAPGRAYEDIDGEETSVSEVKATLLSMSTGNEVVWDGSPYNQFNPTMSYQNGAFAWYVPNGPYRVRLDKDGYKTAESSFTVSNFIANPQVLMISLAKKPEEEPMKEIVLPAIIPDVAQETIKVTIQAIRDNAVAKVVSKSLDVVRENPTVQTAAQASVPTLAVTAGASVVVMSVSFNFLPFIQYLFTAPVLFFWRKKRKGFGTIYNTISKEPVDLAVVRLFEVKEDSTRGRLIRSRVTDKGGRFFFLVQPGKYLLTVTKAGFTFPTSFLASAKEDVQFLDLYHGEILEVSEKDAVLTPNIPLDPSVAEKFHEPKQILWRARLRFIQHIVALSGVIASAFFAIIRPNMLAAGMVVLQIGIYLIVQRIAKPRKPKSWGIVYDTSTKRPLANVVARIFEPKYNKLLDTQVTDSRGRYTFLLGPSEYFAVFEKPGYVSTQVKPIDYKNAKESKDFSEDIELHPITNST